MEHIITKNWNSILEMLSVLNEQSNYLIMRNFELFENNRLIKEHEDIDLLCDDINKTTSILHASAKNKDDLIHYWISVCDQKISLDIRCIGDSYYDEAWEKNMLKNRRLYKESFYTMSEEDYYYSLIYHGLYHKDNLKQEYIERLQVLAKKLNFNFQINHLSEDLKQYMQKHGYKDTGYKSL